MKYVLRGPNGDEEVSKETFIATAVATSVAMCLAIESLHRATGLSRKRVYGLWYGLMTARYIRDIRVNVAPVPTKPGPRRDFTKTHPVRVSGSPWAKNSDF